MTSSSGIRRNAGRNVSRTFPRNYKTQFASSLAVVPLVGLAYSGYFKGAPFLQSIPVDMTGAFAVICGCVIAVEMTRRTWRDLRTIPAVLMLWVIFCVGAAMDMGASHPKDKLVYLFSVTLLCALAPCFVLGSERAKKWFLICTIVCSILMGLAASLAPDLVAADEFGRLNLQGATTIGTARVLGAGALIATILSITLQRGRWWWRLASILGITFTVAVGSRGPVISLLVSFIATVLLGRAFHKRRARATVQLAIIISTLICLAIAFPSAASERIALFITGEDSDMTRESLYGAAWSQLSTSPLGVGWGGFRLSDALHPGDAGRLVYPHNMILEITVEGGWIAGIAFVTLMGLALRGLIISSTSSIGVAFLGLGVYWFSVAQTSSDINGNRMTWVMLSLGLISRYQAGIRPDIGYVDPECADVNAGPA